MQGNLEEIDIPSILRLVELGQHSGTLWVEEDDFNSKNMLPGKKKPTSSNCFFVNGKITYATGEHNNSLTRFQDYLYQFKIPGVLENLPINEIKSINICEYGCLGILLQNKVITKSQGCKIIQNMIQEILFKILSIKKGIFYFGECNIDTEITSFEITPLLKKVLEQKKIWKLFYPYISSPLQCPVITDEDSLKKIVSDNTYKRLSLWADGKTSFEQIARYLNQDFVTIAQAMYPHIKKGWLKLKPDLISEFECVADDKTTKIIIITSEENVYDKFKMIFTNEVELTMIKDPLEALKVIFEVKPDLIICNLPSEEVKGCELCNMLKTSNQHRHIPWIMLIDENDFQLKLRYQLVGVTDYLSKPFNRDEALNLLNKHVISKQMAGNLLN